MDLNEQQIGIKVYNNNATPPPEHETLNPSSNPPQQYIGTLWREKVDSPTATITSVGISGEKTLQE